MASFKTRFIYLAQKLSCSLCLTMEKMRRGELKEKTDAWYSVYQHFTGGRLTYLYRIKGNEMAPTIPGEEEMLLVRKVPRVPDGIRCSSNFALHLLNRVKQEYKQVCIGDVVVFKNPLDPDMHLVRRVAADGGYEMVSTDEKEEPFVLGNEELWVLSDNQNLKPQEAKDSRTYGPISMTDIVGRVLYRMQSAKDHGPVQNSDEHKEEDDAVLQVELDVNQMVKSSQT